MARKCHTTVSNIDSALSTFNHSVLCKLLEIEEYENLIGDDLEEETSGLCSYNADAEGLVNIEKSIQVKHANILE